MEEAEEWEEIAGPGGAGVLPTAQRDGKIRWLGLTSHRRKLAATIAETRLIASDPLQRGSSRAEQDIFPVTDARHPGNRLHLLLR